MADKFLTDLDAANAVSGTDQILLAQGGPIPRRAPVSFLKDALFAVGSFTRNLLNAADAVAVKLLLGLNRVDNTNDLEKPISTATATALAGKANSAHTHAQSDVTGLVAALAAKLDTSGFTWGGLSGKPSTFAPSAHTHAHTDITGFTWGNLGGKPLEFPPSAHSHSISDVTGLQLALDGKQPVLPNYAAADGKVLTVAAGNLVWLTPTGGGGGGGDMFKADNLFGLADPAEARANLGVTWDNLAGKPLVFTPAAHTHAIADVNGLQTALDGKAAASHTHSYLPLTGGVLGSATTPLVLNRADAATNVNMEFRHTALSRWLGIDASGNLRFGASNNLSGTALTKVWTEANLDAVTLRTDVDGKLSMSVTGSDWNVRTNGKAAFISTSTNSPTGTSSFAGIYMPHVSGGYGVWLAGRGSELYLRTEENGVLAAWNRIWHAGNITPLDLTTANQTVTGLKAFVNPAANSMTMTGANGSTLEVRGNGTGPAIVQFHRPSAYASYFGIDTDNKWKVGGWSAGAAAYALYHEGNKPLFSDVTPVSTWLRSSDGVSRVHFESNGRTYFGATNGYQWRSSTDAALLTLENDGRLTVANTLTVGGDVVAHRNNGTGSVMFGNTGAGYIYYDAFNFHVAGGQLFRASMGPYLHMATGGGGKVSYGTAAPTGGVDGDIYLQYV